MSEFATLQRKVTQLDNDVSAIYSMLANIEGTQRRHGVRLDAIDDRLDALTAKVDHLDTKFDGLDVKVDHLDTKVDEILALLRK